MGKKRIIHYLSHTRMDWKIAFGSFMSWELAQLAGSKHPYLAPITLILCLRSTVDKSIKFTFQRIIGTIIGIFLTALLANYFGVHGWSIGLLIVIGAMVSRLLGMNEIVIRQMAISILLVLVFIIKTQSYAIDRFRDTLIGAFVAIVFNLLIFPPNFINEAKRTHDHFFRQLLANMTMLVAWIDQGCVSEVGQELIKENKQLLHSLHKTNKIIKKSKENLLVTPFSKKKRNEIAGVDEQFSKVRKIFEHYSSIVQTMVAWQADGYLAMDDQQVWKQIFINLLEQLEQLYENLKNQGLKAFLILSVDLNLPNNIEQYRYKYSLYQSILMLQEDLKKTNKTDENEN